MLRFRRLGFFALTPSLILFTLSPYFSSTRLQQPQEEEVIRVNTDLVVLNIAVADLKGKFVEGLRCSDFKVLEDGREQTICGGAEGVGFSAEETPFAAAVLLDTSGSMEQRMTLARAAAAHFLDLLRPDDVAAVYRFDSKIEQLQEFTSSRDLAPLAFGLRAQGMTMLNDAVLRAAQDLSQRPEKRRAIIVLSDGGENFSRASSGKALERALTSGATLYTVDMSATDGAATRDPQGSAVLRNFAAKTGGRYVPTPGGPGLREAFASISEELGKQYTITYRSSNRARDGRWRAIDVQLTRPNLRARTRKGYHAPKG
jgi:Ca-activated chloride channel homolog